MTPEILVTDTPGQAAYDAILAGIIAYNESQAGPSGHRPLAVLVKDEDGKVLGGLWGTTGWQWLFVHLLWLPETLRGTGLGRDLMHRAEAEAVARGCGNVWLDTLSFQARGFYEKLGYAVFGTLEGYPPGHHRYFLRKRLG
ncbi:MAG TPA: GNAT family N-acetyltransferase [Stellaceae bacterium]|nr:GNAT family N-acetyltransferase [Stellaceae bacterium]